VTWLSLDLAGSAQPLRVDQWRDKETTRDAVRLATIPSPYYESAVGA